MQNIFIDVLPPWVETGLQPAFYDLESGTVLQQTARMYAKVNEIATGYSTFTTNVTNEINQFEQDTNDEIERFEQATNDEIERFEGVVNDTVEEYINKFNELHDYVHDYFDNLDVQEEINNKLDAMVEDGTLQEIIENYLQPNVTWTFDTVADMKSATNLVDGGFAQTYGFYSLNDGGGAKYIIRNPSENETANNITTFEVGELIAELSPENEVSIRQGGAKSVSDFDNSAIINTLLTNFKNVYIPQGTFECNGITIKTGNVLRGSGTRTSILKNNAENGTVITDDNTLTAGATIKNFAIDGNENSADYGLYLDYFTHSSIVENVKVNKCATGCYITKAWYAQFVNLDISQCGRGIEINDNSHEINSIQLVDCYVNGITTDYGIYVKVASHIVNALNIASCTIENTESHGIYIDSNSYDRIRNIKVDSCYFEGNKGNCIDGKGTDLTVTNCYFHPKAVTQTIINSDFKSIIVLNCFEEADVLPAYSIYHLGTRAVVNGYKANAYNKFHFEPSCVVSTNTDGYTFNSVNERFENPSLVKNYGYDTAGQNTITLGTPDSNVDNNAVYQHLLVEDSINAYAGSRLLIKENIKNVGSTNVLRIDGRITPRVRIENTTTFVVPSGTTANRPTNQLEIGAMFYDTTTGHLMMYNGSSWVNA